MISKFSAGQVALELTRLERKLSGERLRKQKTTRNSKKGSIGLKMTWVVITTVTYY